MNFLSLSIVAALVVPAAPARAQDSAKEALAHCVSMKLAAACPDAKPGTADFAACMKAHGGDAVTACRKTGTDAAPTKAGPCDDDSKRLCPGLPIGSPDEISCMRKHKSETSPSCSAWAKRRYGGNSCAADAKKFCPGLAAGSGREYTDCMIKKYDALSPACRANFKKSNTAASAQAVDAKDKDAQEEEDHDDCMMALEKLCPKLKPHDEESAQQCLADYGPKVPACRNHSDHEPNAQ